MLRQIKDFDGYFAHTSGLIISMKFGKRRKLSGGINKKGYEYVVLCFDGKMYNKRVHRLVAEAFIPNPENKPQVNHKDGDKLNNYVDNLEWMTNQENVTHSYEVLGRVKNTPPYRGKRVRCIETGVIYDSALKADQAIGLGRNNVGQAVRGVNPTAGGFRWEFA